MLEGGFRLTGFPIELVFVTERVVMLIELVDLCIGFGHRNHDTAVIENIENRGIGCEICR